MLSPKAEAIFAVVCEINRLRTKLATAETALEDLVYGDESSPEQPASSPSPEPPPAPPLTMAERGRRGGLRGGRNGGIAVARKLTPEQRSERAKVGARARWAASAVAPPPPPPPPPAAGPESQQLPAAIQLPAIPAMTPVEEPFQSLPLIDAQDAADDLAVKLMPVFAPSASGGWESADANGLARCGTCTGTGRVAEGLKVTGRKPKDSTRPDRCPNCLGACWRREKQI